MPMKKRLANKLLWKKLFESLAFLPLGAECKSKSVLTETPFIAASPKIGFGTGLKISARAAAVMLCSAGVWTEARAERFSINDAISQAVLTNPAVGEASADRRATETELRQTQSTLLPQVRLEARVGPEKFTQDITPPPLGNGAWLNGKSGSVVVRQILFDGLASIHEIWRQAARVNAASFRVRERSELTALDAAEAYIDVVRFLRLVALGDQNVMVPACVAVGNDGSPECEPAGSLPRCPSPASNTDVSGRPAGGTTMFRGAESLPTIVNVACASEPSPSLIVYVKTSVPPPTTPVCV